MAKRETSTVKELSARVAKAKGIDADKAGKLVRSRIRGNFDLLATKQTWPQIVTQGKGNKDGNRYPDMPAGTADAIFVAMTKGTPIADALKAKRARAPKATTPAPQVEA
jgi:uncharacterized protein with WD repeat